MDRIRQYIEQFIPITNHEWEEIIKGFQKKECVKGDIILSQGEECDFVAFVESGTLRLYHLKDGNEKVTDFWFSGEFFSNYRSYLVSTPSTHFIECIQSCTLWIAKREYLLALYEKYPNIGKFGRQIAELKYMALAARLDSFLQDSPKERYLKVQSRAPKILQEIPQYMIASYLGISPESLSRLRKRI